MQNCLQLELLYRMFGAELGEETLPVSRVVVDSVETLHIYIGHQPVIRTKHNIWTCICLDGEEKIMHLLVTCLLWRSIPQGSVHSVERKISYNGKFIKAWPMENGLSIYLSWHDATSILKQLSSLAYLHFLLSVT